MTKAHKFGSPASGRDSINKMNKNEGKTCNMLPVCLAKMRWKFVSSSRPKSVKFHATWCA